MNFIIWFVFVNSQRCRANIIDSSSTVSIQKYWEKGCFEKDGSIGWYWKTLYWTMRFSWIMRQVSAFNWMSASHEGRFLIKDLHGVLCQRLLNKSCFDWESELQLRFNWAKDMRKTFSEKEVCRRKPRGCLFLVAYMLQTTKWDVLFST